MEIKGFPIVTNVASSQCHTRRFVFLTVLVVNMEVCIINGTLTGILINFNGIFLLLSGSACGEQT